jgi:hypothetical protein
MVTVQLMTENEVGLEEVLECCGIPTAHWLDLLAEGANSSNRMKVILFRYFLINMWSRISAEYHSSSYAEASTRLLGEAAIQDMVAALDGDISPFEHRVMQEVRTRFPGFAKMVASRVNSKKIGDAEKHCPIYRY